jgi:phospholipid/cholesterol/gamma-HCH transport system substrate-binding protein
VRRIALAPTNIEQVQLTMEIERGTQIKVDTVAIMRTQGLTGIGFIELTKGHQDSPLLLAQPGQTYPVIRSGPSLIARLDSAVTSLLTNVNRSSESFNALMDESNRLALTQTLADLRVVASALAARSGAIDSGLANGARAMENAARLTGELSQLVERIQRSADAFDRMSATIARTGENASDSLDRARAEARQFAAETLPEAQQLVTDLRELTGSLRRLSEQVERNPSVLLYGKPASKGAPGE